MSGQERPSNSELKDAVKDVFKIQHPNAPVFTGKKSNASPPKAKSRDGCAHVFFLIQAMGHYFFSWTKNQRNTMVRNFKKSFFVQAAPKGEEPRRVCTHTHVCTHVDTPVHMSTRMSVHMSAHMSAHLSARLSASIASTGACVKTCFCKVQF